MAGEAEGDGEDEGSDGEGETARVRMPGKEREHNGTARNIARCALVLKVGKGWWARVMVTAGTETR